MKYSYIKYKKAVSKYKKILNKKEIKNIFIFFNEIKEDSFISLAPLSHAAHLLGKDVFVLLCDEKLKNNLFKIWEENSKLSSNYLKDFIKESKKKIKTKYFESIFKRPSVIIQSGDKKFFGDISVEYNINWFKKYKWKKLLNISTIILKNVFSLKKNEKMNINFPLIPPKKIMEMPLEDYLDSFQIAYAMYIASKDRCKLVTLMGSSKRKSTFDYPERVSELIKTLYGCEAEKNIKEIIFEKYKKLSKHLKLEFEIPDVVFTIVGEGYYGKHFFGEEIGYPSLNRKIRWDDPWKMFFKFPWFTESLKESRSPISRLGGTYTLPIDVYIQSVNVDYKKMIEKSKKIADIINKCIKIKITSKGYSNFEFVVKNEKMGARFNGIEAKSKVDPYIFKKTGMKFGMMANIPGGETFITPHLIRGKILGDVVINIDKGYDLIKKPLLIEVKKNKYKILDGPKQVIKKIEEKKRNSWKKIIDQEKKNIISKKIIKIKKNNFNNIGEFAINTNPKAKLCRYLIVNEKIANMIHIALGSGYEPNRITEYHMDVVINSLKQKLNIVGIDKSSKEHWIIRNGKLVIN